MAAAVIGALVGSAGAAIASHQFSDVPNTHPFHDEISAIASAGITTGFTDGTFRPSANVTRQAMAAFMQRGLGRTNFSTGSAAVGNALGLEAFEVVAALEIEAGATGAGSGFVVLEGSWTAFADSMSNAATACPCEIEGLLWDVFGEEISSSTWDDLGSTLTESDFANASGSVSWAFPIEADSTKVFALVVGVNDTNVDEVTVGGTLTATYVPLGPGGTNETMAPAAVDLGLDIRSMPRNVDRGVDQGR